MVWVLAVHPDAVQSAACQWTKSPQLCVLSDRARLACGPRTTHPRAIPDDQSVRRDLPIGEKLLNHRRRFGADISADGFLAGAFDHDWDRGNSNTASLGSGRSDHGAPVAVTDARWLRSPVEVARRCCDS